jgi:hypothetical protein
MTALVSTIADRPHSASQGFTLKRLTTSLHVHRAEFLDNKISLRYRLLSPIRISTLHAGSERAFWTEPLPSYQ